MMCLAKTHPSACVLDSICSYVFKDVTSALLPFFCIIKFSLSTRSCSSTYYVIMCCYISHHKRTPLLALLFSSCCPVCFLCSAKPKSFLMLIVFNLSPVFLLNPFYRCLFLFIKIISDFCIAKCNI